MPGRLRQTGGLSDKAQGCCLTCCETCCRVSGWNKLICYSVILLVVVTLIMIFGGAFITVSSSDIGAISSNVCSRSGTDIEVPLVKQNIYVWYLTNTGIIVTVLIAMTAVCCFSYVGLCCGLNLPRVVKVLAVIGFILLGLGMIIFTTWLVVGGWLISTMGGTEITFQSVCRRIIAYVVFMFVYIVVLIGVIIATCIWSIHGTEEDASKKARPSKKSKPKLPPGVMPI